MLLELNLVIKQGHHATTSPSPSRRGATPLLLTLPVDEVLHVLFLLIGRMKSLLRTLYKLGQERVLGLDGQ